MSKKLSIKVPKSTPFKWLFYLVSILIIFFAVQVFYKGKAKRLKINPAAFEEMSGMEPHIEGKKALNQTLTTSIGKSTSNFEVIFQTPKEPAATNTLKSVERQLESNINNEAENEQRILNLVGSYNIKGWEMYRSKNYEDSMEQFEASLKIKVTAKGYLGKGMVLMAYGDTEDAMENFESSLGLVSSSDAHMMMGIILYQENRLVDAKVHFEKVIAIIPLKREASAYLSKISRELIEDDFIENKGSHFVVKYEGAEEGEAGYLVSMLLEEAYFDVGSDLGFYPKDMITAILYRDRQFSDVTRSPSWAGGLYDGKIRLPIGGINSKTEDLKRVVFHEYTHALIHRITGGNCPAWLNEGIAQHEEGRVSIERAIAIIKSRKNIISLKKLEKSFIGLSSSQAPVAYATSLMAVEYLISQLGIYNVRAILDNLKSGMSGEEAVSLASYMDYHEIEAGVISMVNGR